MARVWIPALVRDLTGGVEIVTVAGARVGEVIDELDRLYPGIKARLCDGDLLRPGLVAAVDTAIARLGLREPVGPNSEVHFLPAIGGGSSLLGER
jgi:molybdopterin synthase sulfur carrier subunit